MPSTSPTASRRQLVRATLIGMAYLLVVQVVYLVIPFTTETLWLWVFGVVEAVNRGQLGRFFLDPEWWLALVYPLAVFALGFLGSLAWHRDSNPLPATVAGLYLLAFVVAEVALGMELAILFVLLAPIAAMLAVLSDVGWRLR